MRNVMRKRYGIAAAILLAAGIGMPPGARAQISTSKHNLSTSGPGTVKATAESQICRFCHIPHKASPAIPLWDHTLSSVSYSQYTSTTFASTYPTGYPNSVSKLCLSCHDGTIAIGSITKGLITVTGGSLLDADQSLAASASSNLGGTSGALLTDDHPISNLFNHIKDPYYTLAGRADGMMCTSCHDAHKESIDPTTKKFLSQSNSGSLLCLKCHNPAYWSSGPSIHKSSTAALPAGWSHNGYATVATAGCEICHKPHSAASPDRLLKGAEAGACTPCHKGTANGGVTAMNVSDASGGPFAKIYRHPTYTTSGKHVPENANPLTASPTESSANVSLANRHAECQDCHNPHGAKSGLHAAKSNALSGVLTGTWGMEPAAAALWMQPSSFTRADPATMEYQICLKCHSYYGLGAASTGVTTIIGPSGSNITDQAMELNINNKAAHPVKVGLNSQTGSVSPRALASSQMGTAWNSVGTQTMYCSDCHGNDDANSSGPHGSNKKFMLTGTRKYWPTTANGTTLWSLNDIKNNTNNWQNDLFCANCHPMVSGSNFLNNVHSRGDHQLRNSTTVYCITCHSVVPHGTRRSRMIGYASEPAPYNFSGTATYAKLVLLGFKKASSPTGYSESNCYTTTTGCTNHSNAGGYDQ